MAQENTTTPAQVADVTAQTPPQSPPAQTVTAPEPSPGPLSSQQPVQQPVPVAAPTTQQTAAAPEHPSVREILKGLGLAHYERYQDDKSVLQDLANRVREAEQMRDYARLGQQVVPHLNDFRKWQADQQAAQQAQQAQAKKWWNPPEFDPRWVELIEQDPQTGELKPRPGAPLDIVQKFQAAQMHSRDFLSKFAFDPVGSIRPGIEEVVRNLAGEMVQEQVNSMQEKLAARELLQNNAGWMYQADPSTGRGVMTPYGQVYAHAVAALDQRGIRDIGLQDEWARDKAAIAMMADQLKQLQAQVAGLQQPPPQTPQIVNPVPQPPADPLTAQQAANDKFTRSRGSRKPSQAAPANSGTPTPMSSLREAMLAALEEEGISRNGKLFAAN